MKILLVLNKPNREIATMEAIKREIIAINQYASVEIREMCAPGFNEYVLKFKPNVILTFPFTCVGFSTWYYLFKVMFKTKIVSLRAEGVINVTPEYIRLFTGFDSYGKYLVDYELFWGPKMSSIIGSNLLRQNKISSVDRCRSIGYTRLESYFKKSVTKSDIPLPARIHEKLCMHSRDKNVFFVTGFVYANYSKQDLINAKDLDAENRIEELLEEVEFTKRYRRSWIDIIIKTAEQNPGALIVVKKHPTENRTDYSQFNSIVNILYVYEDIDINYIMKFAGLFIHYGSTSLVDAYLSKTPSVYAYPEDIKSASAWYSDLGWPSTVRVPISNIPSIVKGHLVQKIPFESTTDIRSILKENFDITNDKLYEPSKNIAKILIDREPAQNIPLSDIYLWKSIFVAAKSLVLKLLSRLIKKVLRMNQDEPLLKRRCSR